MASIRYVSAFRFRVAVVAYAMMLLVAYIYVMRPFDTVLDAFAALLGIFVLACVALWPRTDEDRSVERKLSRRNWADRIDFDGEDEGSGYR